MSMPATGQIAVFAALLGHWKRHRIQAVTLIVGLAAATALWTAVQALNSQAKLSYDRAAAAAASFQYAGLVARDGNLFSDRAFADLRRAGIKVTPILEGRIGPGVTSMAVTGIDPLTFPAGRSGSFEPPSGEDILDFLSLPGALYTAPESAPALARLLEAWPPDERPHVVSSGGVAIGRAIGDIGTVQALLKKPGQISQLMLPERSAFDLKPMPQPWRERLELAEPAASVDLAGLTNSFHLNLTAFGLLCFLVGLFIVYSAIGLAFEERLASLRTLRICGVSRRRLLILMTSEMTLIALLAGAFGVIVGYVIAAALLPDVASSLRGLYGARLGDSLALDGRWWLGSVAISVAGALGASLGALMRVVRMRLLARTGSAAWHTAQLSAIRTKSLVGAGCLAVAALAYLGGDGLLAAFTVMAGILLGAAFLLPLVLAGFCVSGQSLARTPVTQWFWADMRQQLSGLSLALMALLLALGTNIGVGGMVKGFRTTFEAFLEERLAAEIYYFAPTAEDGARIADWLRVQPGVAAVLPTWRARASLGGTPIAVTGTSDHTTYRDTWRFIEAAPDVWDALLRPDALLVNEQLARRQDTWVGDTLTIDTDTGPFTATIAGVYSDYGNPLAEVRVSLQTMARFFQDVDRRQYGVRVPIGAAELLERMKREFGLTDSQVIDQAGLKGYSRGIFEQTFTISGALSGLTLGVAAIALLTSLLTLTSARIAGTAPVWAMGVDRATLGRLELLRILLLALVTALAAIPLGVAISWCLVAVVNVEAFGWRLPLYVFPSDWLRLALAGGVTALVAALYPTLKLQRTAPAELAKIYAHDH